MVSGSFPHANLAIDSEDSLALTQKSRHFNRQKSLDIAVLGLKRLSNFTDFHGLEIQPDVSVRYVMPGDRIGLPDLLILPGSKNTIEDMAYLRQAGYEEEIRHCLEQGVHIFGICGGYQLLGQKISDPYQVETEDVEVAGLGILDAVTVLQQEKQTKQVLAQQGAEVLTGYEIHMGQTKLVSDYLPFVTIIQENGQPCQRLDGVIAHGGQVQGTYLHGIFDNANWTRTYLNRIRKSKGLKELTEPVMSLAEFKEKEYDKLADLLKESLDMSAIYRILEGKAQ